METDRGGASLRERGHKRSVKNERGGARAVHKDRAGGKNKREEAEERRTGGKNIRKG